MQSNTQTAVVSKKMLWAGRTTSTLSVLFLLFDSIIHLMKIDPVVESFAHLGYPISLAVSLGILELFCIVVYVIPRTSILGAVLLTGYLGGAVATQLRIGEPLLSHVFFPVYVGAMIWGGLYFRDNWLRTLVPFRKGEGI